MAGVAPSEADIIFERLGGGTGNNVLFNCPTGGDCAADLNDDDETLIGTVQNTIFEVLFTANVDIQPGASGQATIEEADSDPATVWTSLDLEFLNFDATNEVVLRIKPTDDNTTITLSACDNFNNCTWTQVFTGLGAPAGDFFRARAINGQWITSLSILASNGSLNEVEQVRLGDILDGNNVIPSPEPAVMALFGLGLFAVGFRARRKKVQQG